MRLRCDKPTAQSVLVLGQIITKNNSDTISPKKLPLTFKSFGTIYGTFQHDVIDRIADRSMALRAFIWTLVENLNTNFKGSLLYAIQLEFQK